MTKADVENLFDNFDLFRKWNTLILSNTDEWIAMSFEYVQESVESGCQNIKAMCAEIKEVNQSSDWSEIIDAVVKNPLESTQEFVSATAEFQAAAQQLFREQIAETHEMLKTSLAHQRTYFNSVGADAKQFKKMSSVAEKMAA